MMQITRLVCIMHNALVDMLGGLIQYKGKLVLIEQQRE